MEKDVFNSLNDETQHGLADGILRQRRNLLLVSLIMPFFVSDYVLIEQINLLGTIIDIKSQTVISATIFLIYLYFLWRYWQYYREDSRAKAFRKTRSDLLYDAELKYFSKLLRPKTECFEYEYYYPSFKTSQNFVGYESKELPDDKNDQVAGWFKKLRMMEINGLDDKYKEHYLKKVDPSPLKQAEIDAIESDWSFVKEPRGDNKSEPFFETLVEYNSLYLRLIRLLVRVKFIFVHPYFSDYELPLLIALISLAATIYFTMPITIF